MTTSTDIATRNGQGGALAIRPGQDMFDAKQKAALAVLGIKEATNADLAVFMHYCQKTGLDPFSRQIYMINRREKVNGQYVAKQTIQVGIDGFRVIRDRIAERLGVTVEYEDTIWYDANGTPHSVWLWDDPPAACCVTVVKDGKRFPGVVRTTAYVQRNKEGEPAGQWRTQADHMIEKCAEAFALRRAFPHDLGGIYIEEEGGAAPAQTAAPAAPARVTRAEIIEEPEPARKPRGRRPRSEPSAADLVNAQWERLGISDSDERLNLTAALAGVEAFIDSLDDIADGELHRIADRLSRCEDIAQVHVLLAGDAPADGSDG